MRGSRFIHLLSIVLLIFMVQCSKQEQAPYVDGLYFEYDVVKTFKIREEFMLGMEGRRSSAKVKYKVQASDDGYEINKTVDNATIFFIAADEVILVDKYGKNKELGNYFKLWLPVKGLEIGDAVYANFRVDRKERWKEWDVMVCIDKSAPLAEFYFDSETGFFVGMKAGFVAVISGSQEREEVLINTNAGINVAKVE